MPQENSLFEDLSLEDNLKSVLELKFSKIDSKKIKEIDVLVDLMNLNDKKETLAKFLSGGEKRKTEILRAVLLEAKYILLMSHLLGLIQYLLKKLSKC